MDGAQEGERTFLMSLIAWRRSASVLLAFSMHLSDSRETQQIDE